MTKLGYLWIAVENLNSSQDTLRTWSRPVCETFSKTVGEAWLIKVKRYDQWVKGKIEVVLREVWEDETGTVTLCDLHVGEPDTLARFHTEKPEHVGQVRTESD